MRHIWGEAYLDLIMPMEFLFDSLILIMNASATMAVLLKSNDYYCGIGYVTVNLVWVNLVRAD